MSEPSFVRAEIEAALRALLSEAELPEPDEVLPHEDGGIICLWHAQQVAIVVDPDEGPIPDGEDPLMRAPEGPHLH